MQEFPDGGYWQGKNFVFDKREAVGVGCVEGVGGILRTDATAATPSNTSDKAQAVLGHCCVCKRPWDRYIGKRKCAMCGVPVLLCTNCSSAKGMLDKVIEGKGTSSTDVDKSDIAGKA